MNFAPNSRDANLTTPALNAYANRVGAKQRNFLRYAVLKDDASGYPREVAAIKIVGGKIECNNAAFAPTDAECAAIEAELTAVNFPKSVKATKSGMRELRRDIARDNDGIDPWLFEFLDYDGEHVLFVQQRIKRGDKKIDLPWSLWSDGAWRMMEPDGLLPLFGLDSLRTASRVFIHEGAKSALAARAINDPDLRERFSFSHLENHPWAANIKYAHHVGWPGGALSPHRVDWQPIRQLAKHVVVILVADHDQPGEEAISAISRLLKRQLMVVRFDDRFPERFDLADEWPNRPDWWDGPQYKGPSVDDLTSSATWATHVIEGRPGQKSFKITDDFAKEWCWIETPPVFISRRQCDRMPTTEIFNRSVRPFSDAEDTARLLVQHAHSKVDGVCYRPYRGRDEAGVITVNRRRAFNTFRPAEIVKVKGESAPFLDFITQLIPDESDRRETMRWVATLIARPEVRMMYSILLISETQGIGKTTLFWILRQLVGPWNVSCPTEEQVADTRFNSWAVHKRLVIIGEIYSGKSRKMYDKLKSYVSGDPIQAEVKFLVPYEIDNYVHIAASSNSKRALHLDDVDRRWLVPRVSEELRTKEYWRDFYSWLNADGLGIIASWADKFLEQGDPVFTGEHAPMTSAKQEIIQISRSEGIQTAIDLAERVADLGKPKDKRKVKDDADPDDGDEIVMLISEVRDWIARQRGLDTNDFRMEKPYTIRKALVAGGLQEPRDADGKVRRMTINQRSEYVAANFKIRPDQAWKDISTKRRLPGNDIVDDRGRVIGMAIYAM
jgi:hypothetical protein